LQETDFPGSVGILPVFLANLCLNKVKDLFKRYTRLKRRQDAYAPWERLDMPFITRLSAGAAWRE